MMERELEVSQTFVELADTLVSDFDVFGFLHLVSERCMELLAVDAAGVMLIDNSRQLRLVAASSEEVRLLELFELQNEQGPCLDCYRTGTQIADDDLEESGRWPDFAERALSLDFRAVDAAPMRLRGEVIGALNLFRRSAGPLNDRDKALCQAFADVATIGLLQERAVHEARLLAEQLQTALNNRVVIEQAKGVLAERAAVQVDEAFELMRSYARSRRVRIAAVAADLIEGHLSTEALAPGDRRDQSP